MIFCLLYVICILLNSVMSMCSLCCPVCPKKMEDKLNSLKTVDIDADGTFKYVLIEASVEDKDGKEQVSSTPAIK